MLRDINGLNVYDTFRSSNEALRPELRHDLPACPLLFSEECWVSLRRPAGLQLASEKYWNLIFGTGLFAIEESKRCRQLRALASVARFRRGLLLFPLAAHDVLLIIACFPSAF